MGRSSAACENTEVPSQQGERVWGRFVKKLGLKYSTYGAFWTLYPVQLAGLNAVLYRSVRLGLRRGVFTCVGWQVTLCDPI